jgi:nitrate reductase gamma subunit
MGTFLTFITYIVCIIFLGRFILNAISWIKGVRHDPSIPVFTKKISPVTIAETVLDIFFFRRLFKTNKLLWVGSWAFHVSFLLVILRHMRYFMYPVPGFIVSMQDAGIYAGYMLPLSLLLILFIRITGDKARYVSLYNFFLLVLLLLTSLTGVLLKTFYSTNLVEIKAFVLGISTFSPTPLPDSMLFIIHFILLLLLVPFLPFHVITAPVITIEARRRDEGLDMVLHEE